MRTKLFAAVFGVILVVIAITGFFLAHFLRQNLFSRIEDELTRHAASVRASIEIASDISNISTADPLADKLGEAVSARVTVILADGRVIGDSSIEQSGIQAVENHSNRPEVQAALRTGRGSSRRFSTTLDHEMLYIAVKFERPGMAGVVRVSKPLSEISEAVSVLRGLLAISGLIGLIVAFLVAAISSHVLSRTLRVLVDFAKKMASGERRGPIKIYSPDAFGGLAGSLNKLSEQLEMHVSALVGQRDQFEAVLEGMSEAVVALDENEKVTLINRAGIMLLGLSGQPIGHMLLETIRVPALHDLVASLEPGGDETLEFNLPVQEERIILARATRTRTGGVVVVLLDVTDLRRLENLRRDFVSNVSHELRTPVSIIRANAETLLGGAIDDRDAANRFLASMLTNSERLANLIGDLLDISRIEEGVYDLTIEPVLIATSLRRSAAGLETQAIEKGFTIRVESPGDTKAMADSKALDQVLFNLLDNAVKYAREGGQVVLRARCLDGLVRIEVEDDGPGIAEENRGRLFERFYRVDPGRSREMGGTGLGLAIVKHLALAMDGDVGMEPVQPHGSLFWVSFPGAPKQP
ncbi:MAG: PAS domain-containing protein [Deltaproteobacteria bacterium]|nr:PAS domain-containing protein [Deltaproteobacteria bacterium]